MWAQAFLQDRRLVEGLGIKTGDFELHPGVAGEGGYDSNYFQASGDRFGPTNPRTLPDGTQVTIIEPVVPGWRLRITPSLSFATVGARRRYEGGGPAPSVIFRGGLAATYSALFPTGDNADAVSNQNNVSGNVGAGVDLYPQRRFGADLSADYTRIIEANNDFTLPNAFRRDTVRAGAGVSWRPGGGLFSARVGYGLVANFFEDEGYTVFNNLRHSLMLGSTWRFLPRTALIYRGNVTWLHYLNNPALGQGRSVETQAGLNGLISNYFGLLAMAGWTASFYDPPPGLPAQNFDGFVGQAQITWYPTPQKSLPEGEMPVGVSTVAVGYTRSFGPSYLGTWYRRDRIYANTVYFFGERFVLSLIGGFSVVTRPETFFDNGNPQFAGGSENRVDATAFLEYRLGPTVGLNTTFRYDAELTDRPIPTADPAASGGAPVPADQLQFARYQVYLGLRWFL